jgi:hypothetical protein
MPKLPGL